MIDGYNLDLEKGTGVATYARNLSHTLKNLGYEVGVLYGKKIPRRGNPLLREIGFFDPLPPPTSWIDSKFGPALEFLSESWGSSASAIPLTGGVVHDVYKDRMPTCDSIWNAPHLYTRAHRHFSRWKKVYPVSVGPRPALMHWTYPLPIRVPGARNVYTLHDLIPLRLPYTTLDNKRRYLRLVSQLARNADHIITVSETSRRDIVNLLGVPESRITNTSQAVFIPDHFRLKSESSVRRELLGTLQAEYKEYFLYFGAIEPKKNVGRLIEAYLASNSRTPLFIVGPQAWKTEQELKLLNTLDSTTRQRVRLMDYVSLASLISLIRGAKAIFFPSLYEGFGLPVLESMMLGTPVLSSNSSSIPEIAGDAALLIDPYDINGMAEAIRALDSNAELRASLSARGLKRAALFSQERYAKILDETYSRILAG